MIDRLAIILFVFARTADGACSLCANGEEATLLDTGILSNTGLGCSMTASTLLPNIAEDSEHCYNTQLDAFLSCGCPTYPDNFCPMCNNDEYQIPSPFRVVPLSTLPNNTFCRDALFMDKKDGFCTENKRAAHFCGCPNAPAPLCDAVCKPPPVTAAQARNSFGPTPSADRRLPPHFNMTCGEMHLRSPFMLTNEECSNLQDPSYNLIDEDTYCCSNSVPQQAVGTCDMCSGSGLKAPQRLIEVATGGDSSVKMTCQDLQTLSFVVTSDTFCTNVMQQSDWVNKCCQGFTDPPTQPPTTSPTEELTGDSQPTSGGGGNDSPSLRPTKQPTPSGNPGNPGQGVTGNSSDSSSPRRNTRGWLLWSLALSVFAMGITVAAS